jgi:DNA-binding HxlR family transcriptional regulator
MMGYKGVAQYAIVIAMERMLQTSSSSQLSPHSVLMAHCPSRQVLELIADKWTALIFALLERQPTRFNELQRAIDGISHKVLTQTLRNLEQRGIVQRKITPTNPPAVEYSLSPLGTTLIPLMAMLRQWAEEHMEEVEQARQAYGE